MLSNNCSRSNIIDTVEDESEEESKKERCTYSSEVDAISSMEFTATDGLETVAYIGRW